MDLEKNTIGIGDFGSAIYLPELQPEELSDSTLLYRAPEVIRFEGVDLEAFSAPARDIWAMGLVLWEFWHNTNLPSPLRGNTCQLLRRIESLETVDQITAVFGNLFAETIDSIDPLIRQMLNPNPRLRISASDAVHMLDTLEPSVAAFHPPVPTRRTSQVRQTSAALESIPLPSEQRTSPSSPPP